MFWVVKRIFIIIPIFTIIPIFMVIAVQRRVSGCGMAGSDGKSAGVVSRSDVDP